jgi:hypothetical protein
MDMTDALYSVVDQAQDLSGCQPLRMVLNRHRNMLGFEFDWICIVSSKCF